MTNNSVLTGIGSPTAYAGVKSPQPPNIVRFGRAPVSGTVNKDIKNFTIGDIWIDDSVTPNLPYILVSKTANTPTWSVFTNSGGGTNNFITNSGTATEVGGNLNVVGGDLINTAGSGSTVTINLNRGTDAQLIIAHTGAAANYGSVVSSNSTITAALSGNNLNLNTSGSVLTQISDDDGGMAVPSAGVITFHDGTGTEIAASGSGVTVSVIGAVATVYHTDSGDATPAANALTIHGTNNITTSGAGSTVTVQMTGTTTHAVQIGNASAGVTSLAVGSNGQVLIGSTGADPAFSTITSSDSSITFTPGANTLDMKVAGKFADVYTTDNGNVIPSSDVINVNGGVTSPEASANINTYADGAGSNNLKIALNNTIQWPTTNGAGTQGVFYMGGNTFFHQFGANNTFVGQGAGNLTLTNTLHTGIGTTCLNALTSSQGCTAIGAGALRAVTTGRENCGHGSFAGQFITTGQTNDLFGGSVATSTDGVHGLITGSYNVMIGSGSSVSTPAAGSQYTNAESHNILIRNNGVTGESNTMRLGTSGSGTAQVNRCFIAGIRGITTGNADAINVLIDSAGQLGTVSSSERYKQNIQDMYGQSAVIMKLRPVLFNYKKHPDVPAWGLIAEEVDQVFPQLVVYNEEGKPESVKYHDLTVLLLNELQRLEKRVQELEAKSVIS